MMPPAAAAAAAEQEQEKREELPPGQGDDVDAVTRKWGLEAGLWKDLLARYGVAYLATSISLSGVSFSLFYLLFSAGVDVPALLEKVGVQVGQTGETVGTVALAYAAHKAASPIRFPPTVALTPIVAGWIGKKPVDSDDVPPLP
eukprot:SM000220S07052  [mRNA]  locus=s220:40911:41857:- [translate_table: standard]